MKRFLHQGIFEILYRELNYLESIGKLQQGQAKELMSVYTYENKTQKEKSTINGVQILLTIGAILVGLGILSFVASNWSQMTSITKYITLLTLLAIFFISGRLLEEKRPTLSKALYYMGVFTFGAEIFYIGQLFHLGGQASDAFLIWGIGILPLAYYLKDKYLKPISLTLIYIFIEVKFLLPESEYQYGALIVLPLLFLVGHFILKEYQRILKWVNLALVYQYIQVQFLYIPVINHHYPLIFIASIPILFFIGYKYYSKERLLYVLNTLTLLEAFIYCYSDQITISRPVELCIAGVFFLVLMPLIYYLAHRYYEKDEGIFTINTLVLISSFITLNNYYTNMLNVVYLLIALLLLGITLVNLRIEEYKKYAKFIGIALHFITTLYLTFPYIWEEAFPKLEEHNVSLIITLVIGIAYCIYALTLVAKNNLLGVAIICVLVLRFYVDLSLQFMSKSITFIIGGVLLIALGYWFERTRKGGKKNEQTNKE